MHLHIHIITLRIYIILYIYVDIQIRYNRRYPKLMLFRVKSFVMEDPKFIQIRHEIQGKSNDRGYIPPYQRSIMWPQDEPMRISNERNQRIRSTEFTMYQNAMNAIECSSEQKKWRRVTQAAAHTCGWWLPEVINSYTRKNNGAKEKCLTFLQQPPWSSSITILISIPQHPSGPLTWESNSNPTIPNHD